jgi:trehalose-phosphatase
MVPIKEKPERALFPPRRKSLLRRLGGRAFVGIVSGRSLAEIQRLVAAEDVAYIGNHGLEISCGRRHWVHPEAKETRSALKKALKNIHHSTRDFPGILVEDKGVTGAVHYRLAEPALWKPLREVVGREIERSGRALKMTAGKRVFEIRPNVAWDKGKGVLELMGWLRPKGRSRLIYLGDDRTDEDAFRAVNRSDRSAMTIHVGRAKATQARHRLADVNEVWTFLRALLLSIPPSPGEET